MPADIEKILEVYERNNQNCITRLQRNSDAGIRAPINLKYSGNPEFEPYEMSGDSAHRLMLDLREKLPNQ